LSELSSVENWWHITNQSKYCSLSRDLLQNIDKPCFGGMHPPGRAISNSIYIIFLLITWSPTNLDKPCVAGMHHPGRAISYSIYLIFLLITWCPSLFR